VTPARRFVLCGTVALITLISISAAWSQDCRECHADLALAPTPHGKLECRACHGEIDLSAHPGDAAADGNAPCSACHEVGKELSASVHAGFACAGCHGPAHDIVPLEDPASPLSLQKQPETCGACHEASLVKGYRAGVHGGALFDAGLVAAPTCSSCHGGHEILPSTATRSLTAPSKTPETCGSCHRFLLDTWVSESAHGLAWKAEDPAAPVCTTCHASHGVDPPKEAAARLRLPESCGGCHGELYASYRDGFHGSVTELGFFTAATCSDCHTPHRNLPAADPRSSVHPDRLVATCASCHGDVSAAFASYDPHADPTRPTSHPGVHLIWLFMTGLLLGVFGFFGVHDLLWLQRSVVGAIRGEFASDEKRSGRYVRRFSRLQVWLHVTVVITFLLLAATGLPLKFHSSGWAQQLADLFGGVSVTRQLHRLAAVATFGYFLGHLAHLFQRSLLGREAGLFSGPNTMLPRLSDLRDLGAHVRYFLYRGPRPRFDRWTYWEKFDYFAVFWGVVIIGISGLMLWFPGFFTRWLPGWTLNAAFVIHSEEALLAVGFIFVFHFFHTHLRPESFPLDPVIFVDRMPLERLREERPLEYERLLASGELERLLVSAPTRSQLAIARFFGFAALSVGLALAIAILWGFLGSIRS
jgi:cytochrome b subunit of formate dehydrogenase